ncbi:MAG: hypothetical protein ACE5E9_07405 [Nitrospinaceae bacterium]
MNDKSADKATQPNDIDVAALFDVIHEVEKDPGKGKVKFHVVSGWAGNRSSYES